MNRSLSTLLRKLRTHQARGSELLSELEASIAEVTQPSEKQPMSRRGPWASKDLKEAILKQYEELIGGGCSEFIAAHQLKISESTLNRWRAQAAAGNLEPAKPTGRPRKQSIQAKAE